MSEQGASLSALIREVSDHLRAPMTTAELRKAERAYQRAAIRTEQLRQARNAAVRAALAEGWTHARISEATGLTRSRVGQIALTRIEGE